jgi:hypothetical protein
MARMLHIRQVLFGTDAAGFGGALRISGQVKSAKIAGCKFRNNSAHAGGAVYLSSPATITWSSFTGNAASGMVGTCPDNAECALHSIPTSRSRPARPDQRCRALSETMHLAPLFLILAKF